MSIIAVVAINIIMMRFPVIAIIAVMAGKKYYLYYSITINTSLPLLLLLLTR